MFIIPKMYQMEMDLDTAERVLKGAKTTVIDMMENVQSKWELHCSGHHFFADDDEFFDHWKYEVNAYNVMYKEVGRLFVG